MKRKRSSHAKQSNCLVESRRASTPGTLIVYRGLHHRETTRTYATSFSGLEEQEESGGIRLSLSDLQNFSSFKYDTGEPTQKCIVCLERFVEGEICRSLPRCNHVFHASCVDSSSLMPTLSTNRC
ncbi:hypothetical protein C5167_007464 [Papaver somniferum]|nr:hypothetical protein C5167_007464 [Papaver somniferum]